MSILLVSVLAISSCGKPGDRPVARVNGAAIAASEVAAAMPLRADSTANLDSIRHSIVNSLVNKQLFIQEARRQGLEKDIEYQLELEQRATVNQELYNAIVEPANRLNEMELQTAYKLYQTEAHLKVIAVKDESTAQRLVQELDRGVPFETLAVRSSRHGSAANGGDVGFVPELYVEEPVRSRVLPLKPGQHTPPVLVDNGWQILLLVETRPNEQAPPLSEFRQELEMRLKQQRRRELAQRFLADLRARLEYNPQGLEILKARPVDSITDAEKEVPVAVKDGTKYVKVLRLLKVAARFPPDLDTAMKTYAVKREIEEDLIYQEALGRKLDRKPEVREQLARKRDDLLYQALFKKEVSDSLSVTDGDVFAYWHQNRDKFPNPDSLAAAGMIRNRLLAERRQVRLQQYADRLRAAAKISINEKLLAAVKREPPKVTTGGKGK